MLILIVTVLLTLLISSQCSLYESTLYSTRIATLESARSKGAMKGRTAQIMLKMKKEISIPIAAILILNTVANTAGATIAGMYAHKALGAAMVPLFSVVFTLAILFIAEIIPKTLGAVHWRTLWPYIVWPLDLMQTVLYPLIKITEKLNDLLFSGHKAPSMTEEEILGAIRLGSKEGEISEWEGLVVHNLISLENKQVRQIMTPRTVMFALDGDLTVAAAFGNAGEKGFSRIPVYAENTDNIMGYVLLNELGSAKAQQKPDSRISAMIKPITFVPESENCMILLTKFLKKRHQIAIVEDEYGAVLGLVTLEDLIETMLGAEIVDEKDLVVDLQKLARKQQREKRTPK